jgi:hypothetical protein
MYVTPDERSWSQETGLIARGEHIYSKETPTTDYLSESDSLKLPAITDHFLAASSKHSHAYIVDPRQSYTVGDTVRVSIVLSSGYNKSRTMGGDHLQVWMREKTKNASSCGHVVDHGNGTYTATLTAFWAGEPEILVSLVYPREAVRALYHVRKVVPALRVVLGRFRAGAVNEATTCNALPVLKTSHSEVCNLTAENTGMSFYCIKPKNINLLCNDWEEIKNEQPYPDLPLTNAEKTLLSS